MSDLSFLEQMRVNIAKGQQRVVRQTEIINHLVIQGHHEAAARAEMLLATMHDHLDIETKILDRLETAERIRSLRALRFET